MEKNYLASYQKKGRKLRAWLGFLDESGISLKPIITRTWAPKGQTPIIKTSSLRWERRSVIGLIKCRPNGQRPKFYLRIFKTTIGSNEVIRFFKELKRHIKQDKIILLWDRLPAHRSHEMATFLDSQTKWLSVEWFPAYAPELNPVEYLWSCGKRRDLANLYTHTLTDLDRAIRRFGGRVRGSPNLLTGFLKASQLFKKEFAT